MRDKKELRMGYHVSITRSMDLAFDRAHEIGCTAMQVFVSNPRGWRMKELGNEERERFLEKSKRFDIRPVVAHMPYLPNLASSNKETYGRSIEALRANVGRCNALGIEYLVTHLGSHLGRGVHEGIRNVVAAIESVQDSRTRILLENTAGHRNSVGSTIEELAEIHDKAGRGVGFCLDTCHLFASGYDIRKVEVLDEMDDVLDFNNVYLLHVNDARQGLGSHLDRHENIGKGRIGVDGFREFFSYKDLSEKPMILETPMSHRGFEKRELGLMRSIVGS